MFRLRVTVATTIITLIVLGRAESCIPLQGNGTTIPLFKHSSLMNVDNTVNLDVLHSHSAAIRAKVLRSFDNYEKNTGKLHPAASKRIGTKNDDDGLELTGHKKELWYGTITIGTPPMPFTEIDTGSGDLFLPSSTCDSSCDGHTRWNPANSDTARNLDRPFEAKYGDGGVASGKLYVDNVTIAGLTVTAQAIGAATSYSSDFGKSFFPPDGRMGLAFHTVSSYGENTIFETLVAEKKVTNSVFSLRLTPTGGELYMGGWRRPLYAGDFTYTEVTEKVNMKYVQGNGKKILQDIPAIIDSGANHIYGNPLQVYGLHRKLGGKRAPPSAGQGVYTFPCENFPSVSLTFGDRSFPVNALNLGRVSPDSADCFSGILDLNTRVSFWVIGGVFLQNVYTVFDLGNLQVGFADLAGEGSTIQM